MMKKIAIVFLVCIAFASLLTCNIDSTYTDAMWHYELDLTVKGDGDVSISPDKQYYTSGDEVKLSADPDSGCVFTGWSGDASGDDDEAKITINADAAVTAKFEEIDRNVVVYYSATTWGANDFEIDYQLSNEGNVDVTALDADCTLYDSDYFSLNITAYTLDDLILPLDIAVGEETSYYNLDGTASGIPEYIELILYYRDEFGEEFSILYTGEFVMN